MCDVRTALTGPPPGVRPAASRGQGDPQLALPLFNAGPGGKEGPRFLLALHNHGRGGGRPSTTLPRTRRGLGPAGCRPRGGVWEGEIMAVEPSKTEIQTLFKRLRAAPANKVAGSGQGPPGCPCRAVALWLRPALRLGPGGLRAALRRLLGRPGRGPWGAAGQSGRGRRVVAGGGGAAELQPGCPSAFALVVLRLRRQEPELGQYHLRGLPVHRLLRRPQVPGRAPQLHQVRGERGRGATGRPAAAIPPGVGARRDWERSLIAERSPRRLRGLFAGGSGSLSTSKAPRTERRRVAFTNLAETLSGLGIVGTKMRVWSVNLASSAAAWCT